ncbi:MAG: hypothetical protein ICV72_05170, partial [Aldersonia sp.]|nr:hypothetical protein [Aldersonia sp.]
LVLNGQPAVVTDVDDMPFGVVFLDVRHDGIAAITVFSDADLGTKTAQLV